MVEKEEYCDTELSLGVCGGGGRRKRPPALDISSYRHLALEARTSSTPVQPPAMLQEQKQQRKKLTIFYEGRVCACNITENQARTIICMAQKDMERISSSSPPIFSGSHPSPSPTTPSPTMSPTPLLPQLAQSASTTKRSLRHFLQNKRIRATSSSPHR